MSAETMRTTGLQDEEAQVAYVLGMDVLAALCRQLASERGGAGHAGCIYWHLPV